MVSEMLHVYGPNGRTVKPSSLAFAGPFSKSEMFPFPLLNGSFSSVEGPFRFFRLSEHVAYRYNAPSITNII